MGALRIAYDTSPLYGRRTGIGAAVASLRDALLRRTDVAPVDYTLSMRARLQPATRRLPLPAAAAHRVWARVPFPRVDRWLGDVELIHGTNYVVPPSRHPRVVSVYDLWFLRHPEAAAPAVRRAAAVLRAAVDDGAVVHTSSAATEAAVREYLPRAAVRTVHLGTLPLGPADGVAPIAELQGRPFVVAVGTLERRKNLPRLIAAFGDVAASHTDLLLVLAGPPGDDSDAVTAAIDALGPSRADRVIRTGWIDESARCWLVRHATVVAYPSLDEGFGFPLLDAMQAGVPLVASRVGSIPEVAGGAALLCDPLDPSSIAASLLTAIDDSEVRRRVIADGAARWQHFDWDRTAAGMVDLYRDVVDGMLAR